MPTALISEDTSSVLDFNTTFTEARALLRVSRSKLYRLMHAGVVTGKKVGATWRFSEQELRSGKVFRDAPVPKVA